MLSEFFDGELGTALFSLFFRCFDCMLRISPVMEGGWAGGICVCVGKILQGFLSSILLFTMHEHQVPMGSYDKEEVHYG